MKLRQFVLATTKIIVILYNLGFVNLRSKFLSILTQTSFLLILLITALFTGHLFTLPDFLFCY